MTTTRHQSSLQLLNARRLLGSRERSGAIAAKRSVVDHQVLVEMVQQQSATASFSAALKRDAGAGATGKARRDNVVASSPVSSTVVPFRFEE